METYNNEIDSGNCSSSLESAGCKRTLGSTEQEDVKRRKMQTFEENRSINTFANNRLKKLREKIANDIVASTSTINPSILTNSDTQFNKSVNFSGNFPQRKYNIAKRYKLPERIKSIRRDTEGMKDDLRRKINSQEEAPNITIISRNIKENSSGNFEENRKFHTETSRITNQSYFPTQLATSKNQFDRSNYNNSESETVENVFSHNRINVADLSNFEIETKEKNITINSNNCSEISQGMNNKEYSSKTKNKNRLLRINPASIAIIKKRIDDDNVLNLRQKVGLALRETENDSGGSFSSNRKVESTKGLLNISVSNDKNQKKNHFDFSNYENLETENNSIPYSPTEPYINPEFQQSVQKMWEKKTPEVERYSPPFVGKSASSIQNRLKNNRFSSPNFSTMNQFTPTVQNTISLPSTPSFPYRSKPVQGENLTDLHRSRTNQENSTNFSLSGQSSPAEKNSISLPSTPKGFTSVANKSIQDEITSEFSSLCKDKKKPETPKFWINYGQIINSLHDKLFKNFGNEYSGNRKYNNEEVSMEWEYNNEAGPSSANAKKEKKMYIVVDTNIFLHDLRVLKEIVSGGSSGGTKPILYVPWMVLNELDYMKDDLTSKMKFKAIKAVTFINKALSEGGEKLLGQNVFKAGEQKYVGKSPDDKVLACCLQAKIDFGHVILLSNDVNLKNKALVNSIPAFSTEEIFKTPPKDAERPPDPFELELRKKFTKLVKEMGQCCSFLICECAEEEYGKAWNRLAMLDKPPPWSLADCLQIFQKYWPVIFRGRLMKHCQIIIAKLEDKLLGLERYINEDEFNDFFEICLDLCIYFKDLENHKNFVNDVILNISEIKNGPDPL